MHPQATDNKNVDGIVTETAESPPAKIKKEHQTRSKLIPRNKLSPMEKTCMKEEKVKWGKVERGRIGIREEG